MSFTDFCTESSYDFVTLYDGNDENAPQIARISGCPPSDTCFTASNGAMYVRFTSDFSAVYSGFNATYASIPGKDCQITESVLSRDKHDAGTAMCNSTAYVITQCFIIRGCQMKSKKCESGCLWQVRVTSPAIRE